MGSPARDTFVIREDAAVTLDFLANDQRDEGDQPYFQTPLPYWLSIDAQHRLVGNPHMDYLAAGERVTTTLQYGITGASGTSGTVPISIVIVGRNDAPVFAAPGVVYVGEHAPNGSLVTTVRASDADRGAQVRYSLSNDDAGRFAIDAATGQISVVDGSDLDRARAAIERITVVATDQLGARDTLNLAIRVVPSIFAGDAHVARHYAASPAALYGTDGADRLIDTRGNTLLAGGAGDDVYTLTGAASVGYAAEAANAGYDTVIFTGESYALPDHVERLLFHGIGEQRARFAAGNALDNVLTADDGGGSLYGLAGNDRITGGYAGGNLYGGDGDDILVATSRFTALDGGRGDDVLYGENAREYGSAGADRFVFRYGTGTTEIYDFTRGDGDVIDLHLIDANTGTPGNAAFRFIGSAAFTGEAGEIRYVFDVVGETTTVFGDTNGDTVADFSITLAPIPTLLSTDFLL